MSSTLNLKKISYKDRPQKDVVLEHLWGTFYFLFPFYVLTKTENTILYAVIFCSFLLFGLGVFRYVLPLAVKAGLLVPDVYSRITEHLAL